MLCSTRKTTVRLSLLAAALCLWAGCELLGLGGSVLVRPHFETAGDLADRTRVLVDTAESETSGGPTASGALSLTPVMQVHPPVVEGKETRASHLSYDSETERLHVGYKLAGDIFGGGIDVLVVQSETPVPGLLNGVRSLRSNNVDIVEVQYDPGEDVLFVAGAVTTRKRAASPALVAKVALGKAGPTVRSERLSHNVVKGIVLGPASNTVHVVTDRDALYRFDRNLGGQARLHAQGAAGFRSLAVHGSEVFVLDRSGRVFREDANVFEELSEIAVLAESKFGKGGIARLQAEDGQLFAALSEEGFSIFAPSGEAVWKSGRAPTAPLYTCVSAGPKYLYAGRFDGIVEVYRRPEGIPNQRPEQVGRFELLGGGGYAEFQGSAPVNHLLVRDGYLYVANGRKGLVVFRIEDGAAAG